MRIRRDDEVIVLSGKDRGKRGKVMRVDRKHDRVYVEGLNIIKRHERPRQTAAQSAPTGGGVIERPGPIHVSNVALVDPRDIVRRGSVSSSSTAEGPRRASLGNEARLMAATRTTARLKTRYENEIRPSLVRRFGYSSPMQAPAIEKITLNMGVGEAKQDSKMLDAAIEQLATIAGQRPNVRRARKSIAAFKLREGMPVGVSVTLRGERSYEFLDRLMSIAIPRIRDFRGLNPRSFDGRGNYSMGVREQIIFPEVDYDAIDQVRGLDITITTSAASNVEAFALLAEFGFPFAEDGTAVNHPARPARARRGSADDRPTTKPASATPEPLDDESPQSEEYDGEDLTARRQARPRSSRPARTAAAPLRPRAGRVPQVRPVPDLPARDGPPGPDPRDDEVLVVSGAPHMSMTDPIADFLTRIRNAIHASHETVLIPPPPEGRTRPDPHRAGLHRFLGRPSPTAPASRSSPPAATTSAAARRSPACVVSRGPAGAPMSTPRTSPGAGWDGDRDRLHLAAA